VPGGSVQIIGDNQPAIASIYRYSESAGQIGFYINSMRGSKAAPAILQTNDNLGGISWNSITTTGARAQAGYIICECTQTPSSGDTTLRSRLSFSAANGSSQLPVFTITSTVCNFTNSLTVGGTAVVVSSDSRLTDARTPLSHTHGNLSNAGAIGSTSGLPIITTTSGVLTTGAFGTTAGSFCQGSDARLSDARTPTTHKSTHATGGSDALTPSDIGALASGQTVVCATGSAAACGVAPAGDLNTGLFFGTNIVNIATGGVQQVQVSSAGEVGIGTAARSNVRLAAFNSLSNVASQVGVQAEAYHTASASASYTTIGISSIASPNISSGVTNNGSLIGANVAALRNSTFSTDAGTLNALRGVTVAYGHSVANTGMTPHTNQSVGLLINPYVGHGTQGDMFDIYIAADAFGTGTATNHWGIFQASTSSRNYFAGNVGIGTTNPTLSSGGGIHCAGSTFRLAQARTPTSSTATGNTGEICWDASYLYVCVSTNTWRRLAHSTW
jgi:hypothetical protein